MVGNPKTELDHQGAVGELGQDGLWRRVGEHERMALAEAGDDLLHLPKVVSKGYVEALTDMEAGVGVGMVDDAGLGQLGVGDDVDGVIGGEDAGGAEADLDHVADAAAEHLDAVAQSERAVDHNGEPRNHVGQGVLGGEGAGQRGYASHAQQGCQLHIVVVEDDGKRGE